MVALVRLYESEQKANDTVRKLREQGLSDDNILVVAGNSPDTVSAAIRAGSMLGRQSPEVFAEALSRGRSLVIANAQFGTGMAVERILDEDAVDQDLVRQSNQTGGQGYHRGTPLSSAMGWPVLIRNNPDPLSRMLGWSTRSQRRSFMSRSLRELTSPNWSFSDNFGMKTTIRNPTWLSSKFGMKVLSDKPMGDRSLGMNLLSQSNPAPLSSKLGMRTLSNNPTPLSSMLGIPVLSRKKSNGHVDAAMEQR